MAKQTTELVIGRGELFFNPLDPETGVGKGEIYIGNTPEFSTSRSVTSLPVFDSYDGQRIAKPGPVVRETHTARFTTDHIVTQNLSLWFGGDPIAIGQNRESDVIETFTVYRDRFYQCGVTSIQPMGARYIEELMMFKAGVLLDANANYELDEVNARIHILEDAVDLPNGTQISITYERRDVAIAVVVSSRKELFGSLRFVSRNPIGAAKNYFYPMVKLSPTGDIDQKSSDWQRISFELEAQRRNPTFEFVYVDEIQKRGKSVTEIGIIDEGGIPIEAFPYWEDILDAIMNVQIPSHNYHL